ncbi:MAG TPA: 6-phosphogluconolactonase, partial [Candidatus Binatia bacterium]|nr:6-phosphogluconolactonase [Candidatus Binatia bacterium]
AAKAADSIRDGIRAHGLARIIAATGASQFQFLEALTQLPEIDWHRVELFHLDEYLGVPITHPASFRKYLLDRLINKVGIVHHHLLDGEQDPARAIAEVTCEIRKGPIDAAFVGIGENGHLAFNDPPADFETEEAYIVVDLDEACRRQQLGEGWFQCLSDVPRRAISMTVRQILRSKQILCMVPDTRKAEAVAKCLQGEITPHAPASILRTHPETFVYLDSDSSALLTPETLTTFKEKTVFP